MGINVFGGLYIVFFPCVLSPLSHVWRSDQSRAPFPFLKWFYMLDKPFLHIMCTCLIQSWHVWLFLSQVRTACMAYQVETLECGWSVCFLCSVWTEMQVLCAGTEIIPRNTLFLSLRLNLCFFLLLIISVVLEKMQRINLVRKTFLSVDGSPSALCSSYRRVFLNSKNVF